MWFTGQPGLAEAVNALYKTELHRNPAAVADNGRPWRGLDDLEIATRGWVVWFNEELLHGEHDDLTPAETEAADYRDKSQAKQPKNPTQRAPGRPRPNQSRWSEAASSWRFVSVQRPRTPSGCSSGGQAVGGNHRTVSPASG